MDTIKALAGSRIRYNKSHTILTAVAIMLTTMLLMGLGTSTVGLLDVTKQQAAANGNVHAVFSGLNVRQVEMLKNHMDVEALEVTEVFATVEYEKMNGYLNYRAQRKEGIYHGTGNLIEGHIPVLSDEICGPAAFFERMGVEPVIGNKIMISFRPNGKGTIQKKEFTICGLVSQIDLSSLDISDSRIVYSALVSEACVEAYLAEEEREYTANIRVLGEEDLNYETVKAKIKTVAENIGYQTENISFNEEYLHGTFGFDADTKQVAGAIALLVIVFSGLVIYSIFYVKVVTEVQEIGKLKALGASKKQIKKLLLTEGMRIAVFAIPFGLLSGYLIPCIVLPLVVNWAAESLVINVEIEHIHMFSLPILLVVTAAVLFVIWLSLLKPMRMASGVSPVEAIRYQESSGKQKIRKGNKEVTLVRLCVANLMRNKRRTIVTMLSMGLSCVLFMSLAGILGSMRTEDIARRNIKKGDFRLKLDASRNDKEYPENNLDSLQQQALFNDGFLKNIEEIPGVEKIEREEMVLVGSEFPSELFADGMRITLAPMDRELAESYQEGVERGVLDYDAMAVECGALCTLDFFMDDYGLEIGDVIPLTVYDGSRELSFTIKIMASNNTTDAYFLVPQEIWDGIGLQADAASDLYITVSSDQYDAVKSALREIADGGEHFALYSMDEEMEMGRQSIALVKYPMYLVLVIIAVISFMNLINTMITSIVTRKRELGILQGIGLSDRQLTCMLAGEGMVFTFGTLTASVTLGNLFGYLAFLWAKENHFMSLSAYHYPFMETVLLILVLVIGQLGITGLISGSVHKESLIDRIRSGADGR